MPRPETEIVVERCLARIAALADPRVLDVGTGSGAIALAIADEHPGAMVSGIDTSAGALEVAGANMLRTGVAIELRQWDLFAGLPGGPWDLVVSNPPYVLPEEIVTLEPEVRDWEPREALVGVGATEAVARGAVEVLRPGGALVLEVASGDAERVATLLRESGTGRCPPRATSRDATGSSRRLDREHGRGDARALRGGELVVVPTDTVYGLACRPDQRSPYARSPPSSGARRVSRSRSSRPASTRSSS